MLVLAVTAMGGAWIIEQPRSSILDWHPRIRLLWRLLPKVRGLGKQFALSQLLFHLAHCLKYNPQRLFEIFLERGDYNDIRNCNLNDHSVEVYQASWWAGMYGAMTWKRHVAWSCCPTIQCLDLGTLCKKFKRHIAKYGIKSTKQCKTHNGKKKGFCGSKHLKSTGMLG